MSGCIGNWQEVRDSKTLSFYGAHESLGEVRSATRETYYEGIGEGEVVHVLCRDDASIVGELHVCKHCACIFWVEG